MLLPWVIIIFARTTFGIQYPVREDHDCLVCYWKTRARLSWVTSLMMNIVPCFGCVVSSVYPWAVRSDDLRTSPRHNCWSIQLMRRWVLWIDTPPARMAWIWRHHESHALYPPPSTTALSCFTDIVTEMAFLAVGSEEAGYLGMAWPHAE